MYLYKNFLVVEREDKYISAKNFVKNTLKIWFDNEQGNVIILIYSKLLNPTDTIREIVHSISFKFNQYENPIGFIKLHNIKNNFRVSSFSFKTEPLKYLAIFKQYLISVIAQLDLTAEDVDKEGFYLHWEENNLTPEWIEKFKTSHLIDNSGKYKFTSSEVLPFLLLNNNWKYKINLI